MNYKVTGILSYCSLLGWLIAFIGGDRSCRHHLNQGFVYAVLGSVSSAISAALSVSSWLLSWLVWPLRVAVILAEIGIACLSILGIISAAQDKEIRLPLGNLFTILR